MGQPDSAREHPEKAATAVEMPALRRELERTRVRRAGSAEAGMIELPDVSVLPALGFLAAAGLLGTAALRRLAPFLDLLEQIAYGVPVGLVVVSLGALLLASALGLSTQLVAVIGLTSAIGALVLGSDAPLRVRLGLWQWRSSRSGARRSVSSLVHPLRSRTGFLPVLVITLLALRWAIFWSGAFRYDSEGLWAGHLDLWGDWALHLGNTSSFAYARNFPPELPQLVGYSDAYHYLTSLTAALMVTAGMDPAFALCLHSFLLSVVVALCIYALARRLTACSEKATLAVILFFLTGSPFFLPDLEPVSWRNVYFTLLVPQRAFLYGLPLLMLVLALLFRAIQGHQTRPFLVAGLVAGLLPLAHLGALLTLAFLTPFLYLLFPSKRWLVFLGAWLGLAGPQLLFQFHDAPAMASSLRLQPGWLATPREAWLWFWLGSLGCLLPLSGWALVQRGILPGPARRFLWASVPVFALANLVVFQPWDWDNVKVLIYWYLLACILVAALLGGAWHTRLSTKVGRLARPGTILIRGLVAGVTMSLILQGLRTNLDDLRHRQYYLLLTAEELQVATAVRTETPERAIFLVGLQHNHPVPMLAGRSVVLGYPGWLSGWGFDFVEREHDVRAIYAFAPEAPQLLQKYHVDYVVIGPVERDQLGADVAAFEAHYATVLQTAQYRIFGIPQEAS